MTLLLSLLLTVAPVDTLTLESAYKAAAEHYPGGREISIARQVRDERLGGLASEFLPSVSLGGQAVYYSDVASIPISIPGMDLPSVSNDQYRLGVTVNQLVYDGGILEARRGIERSASDLVAQKVAVETWGLRERVEAAWFGILLADAESASLAVLAQDLGSRLAQARSRAGRGVSTGSDAEILEVELIRVGQQANAAESRRRAGLDVLEELTGWALHDDVELQIPAADRLAAGPRPEMDLFELSRIDLQRKSDLVSRATRPRVTSFVEAAVGRPQGLNMFENETGPFVSLGIRVGWSLWDWNRSGREREALRLQSEVVTAREDAFLQGIRAAAAGVRRDIERLESHLAGDEEIVRLRERISEESRSKLDNGVITATDYLAERNAEQRARLADEVHRIQLAQARARLVTILGAS